jgi:hypothetical protein
MEPIRPIVIGTTIYLFLYALTPGLGVAPAIILFLFITGNALCLYMVWAILTKGKADDRTFDEGYWYSDVDRKFSEKS